MLITWFRSTKASAATVLLVSLNLYLRNFSEGTKTYIYILVIPPQWHDTGSWNPSSSKTRTCLFHIVNIVGADVLAMQGARASAAMIFTMLNHWYLCLSTRASAANILTTTILHLKAFPVVNPRTAGIVENIWKYTQHCGYWCLSAEAPGHWYPQCWLNTHCIWSVSYKIIIFRVNTLLKYS